MNPEAFAESNGLLRSGIAAHNEDRFDDAGLYLFQSLTCLDKHPAAEPRRDQTRYLASKFRDGGYEDLALLASREAVRLDEALQDHKIMASDLIFYGNVHQRLGNAEEAKGTFREVIDLCVKAGDFGNAASASTNLAALVANGGDGKQAITLLSKSLEYLSKKPFPNTEFLTHVAMIQTVHLHGGDPALAITSGIALSRQFQDKLTVQVRKILVQPLREMAAAYLEQKPQPDPDAWKMQNLPWI